jgi:hypothetical protein
MLHKAKLTIGYDTAHMLGNEQWHIQKRTLSPNKNLLNNSLSIVMQIGISLEHFVKYIID